VGRQRQFELRGIGKVSAAFGLHVIASNLIRLGNLLRRWREHEQVVAQTCGREAGIRAPTSRTPEIERSEPLIR